jgi:O-antigen ligase
MAAAFWLAADKRILYAMLLCTALGLLLMCCILTAELLIEGQKYGRLMWPYGDPVPGSYVAKVGLPIFTIMVALAVSINGRIAALSGGIALLTMGISLVTGERINFLIRFCGGMLAGLVWRPKLKRYFLLIVAEVLAVLLIFSALPETASRYTDHFIYGATDFAKSPWLTTINGGWQAAQNNLMFGIGTGNYGLVAYEGVLDGLENVRPDVHPHNFYIQLLLETGVIGFLLGVLFLWSIIWKCFKQSLINRNNVVAATAWIIPFGLFWPLATTADFFGQWNNIFIWSATALSLSTAATSIGASPPQQNIS